MPNCDTEVAIIGGGARRAFGTRCGARRSSRPSLVGPSEYPAHIHRRTPNRHPSGQMVDGCRLVRGARRQLRAGFVDMGLNAGAD